MNRIFHSKVSWYNYLYLFILGVTSFILLWEKKIIFATVLMILLIMVIERIIHTTYTITTDKQLIIFKGRFSKFKPIPIATIQEVEKIKTLRIGKFYLTGYLLIKTDTNTFGITPVKEREFVNYLLKMNPSIRI